MDLTLLYEAEVEHASIKGLISQIERMDPDEELYDAKVTVLGEYVDHHVKEQQDQIFPQCRQYPMDLKAIGTQLAERKSELTAEISAGKEVMHE